MPNKNLHFPSGSLARKESVKIVNKLIEDWKTIRTYCLMTYQRAMYMENDCVYPIDIIEKKRDKLYKLGLDT